MQKNDDDSLIEIFLCWWRQSSYNLNAISKMDLCGQSIMLHWYCQQKHWTASTVSPLKYCSLYLYQPSPYVTLRLRRFQKAILVLYRSSAGRRLTRKT